MIDIPFCDPAKFFSFVADRPHAVFLDSAAQHSRYGRYSYVVSDPVDVIHDNNPGAFDRLKSILAKNKVSSDGSDIFKGGFVGFFSYDLARELEHLPVKTQDDLELPFLAGGIYDVVVVFDHQEKKAWIEGCRAESVKFYQDIAKQIASVQENPTPPFHQGVWQSNLSEAQYCHAVERAVRYIYDGDIFQVNLAQRFQTALPEGRDPYDLYLAVRKNNPAPYAAFLNMKDFYILSASPEQFLKVAGNHVTTSPIKGTIKRSNNAHEDEALKEKLRTSQKDFSENVMIVDLLRNDLSKVCRPHSVQVTSLAAVESFATVHHLVSVVEAVLKDGQTAVDVLKACWPGGSITGAPKVRAMEIIEELEINRRGPYCGSIGYVGFDGAMHVNIAIRTMIIKDNTVYLSAGGGIVAESNPSAEYQESCLKADVMKRSVG